MGEGRTLWPQLERPGAEGPFPARSWHDLQGLVRLLLGTVSNAHVLPVSPRPWVHHWLLHSRNDSVGAGRHAIQDICIPRSENLRFQAWLCSNLPLLQAWRPSDGHPKRFQLMVAPVVASLPPTQETQMELLAVDFDLAQSL